VAIPIAAGDRESVRVSPPGDGDEMPSRVAGEGR